MNPIFVIFVLVILGLQDYGINPVSGYDMETANQIIYCANAVYETCMDPDEKNILYYVPCEVDDGTINKRVRDVLNTVPNGDVQLERYLQLRKVNVSAKYILGLE